MKKIEAVIRPERISSVKARLIEIGVGGMTLIDASGWSKERELHLQWRGQKIAYDLVPKIKIEIIVPDEVAESVIKSITETAKTEDGHAGDGIIFVSTIDKAISIGGPGADEKGKEAISSS
jgi:nitrogen regulatory protein P-II 1